MTSFVILNSIFLTFINEPPAIEATNLSHIRLLGSSILASGTYPFTFINKVEGPFHFPPCLFDSSSSSRRLRARTPPPPSTFASAPTKAAASTCFDQRTATHLRYSAAPVSIPLLEHQICIRVSTVRRCSSPFFFSFPRSHSFDPNLIAKASFSSLAPLLNLKKHPFLYKIPSKHMCSSTVTALG